MLNAILGRIRAPRYAQLTIAAQDGKLRLGFSAQSEKGTKTRFEREYEGELVTAQVVTDLLGWLKHTAKTFYGSEHGGL